MRSCQKAWLKRSWSLRLDWTSSGDHPGAGWDSVFYCWIPDQAKSGGKSQARCVSLKKAFHWKRKGKFWFSIAAAMHSQKDWGSCRDLDNGYEVTSLLSSEGGWEIPFHQDTRNVGGSSLQYVLKKKKRNSITIPLQVWSPSPSSGLKNCHPVLSNFQSQPFSHPPFHTWICLTWE